MDIVIFKTLGIGLFLIFLFLMLFLKGDKNKYYINFIILSLPFQHFRVVPVLTLFDLATIVFFVFFYKRKKNLLKELAIFRLLIFGMAFSIYMGFLFSSVKLGQNNYVELFLTFPIFVFAKILIDECYYDKDYFFEVLEHLKIPLIFSLVFLVGQIGIGMKLKLVKELNPNVVIANGFRYPSFLSDPQQYSQFLGLSSFLCLIKRNKSDKIGFKNYLLVILSLAAILSTGGRAGLMGWSLGLFFFIIFSDGKLKIIMLLAAGIVALFAFLYKDKLAMFNRGTDMNDMYDLRAGIWADAIDITSTHPVFGIGLNNYRSYVSIYKPDQLWVANHEVISYDQPESGYLRVLTETGILGFICMFTIILIPIFKLTTAFIKEKDTNYVLLFSSLLCWLVGYYSTDSLGEVRIKIMVAVLLCMIMAYAFHKKQERLGLKTAPVDEDEDE